MFLFRSFNVNYFYGYMKNLHSTVNDFILYGCYLKKYIEFVMNLINMEFLQKLETVVSYKIIQVASIFRGALDEISPLIFLGLYLL